jgi:predicted homoserine dehydrogenase-like protein
MKNVRVGVIGSGYWGPNLIRNFVEIPSADVVAVADLSEDRLTWNRRCDTSSYTLRNRTRMSERRVARPL